MGFLAIELADGSEWACEAGRGSSVGRGLFSRRRDGTWQQHTGTGQTPAFSTPQQLSRWLHARYRNGMGERLPRMRRAYGWAAAA